MNALHPASGSVFFALRFVPGDDLLKSLQAFIEESGARAGFIAAAVGSLSSAGVRFAGRSETTTLHGCYELLSLSGTLDPKGVHLHLAIADPDGNVLGGHAMEGCIVRTTMELVIGSLSAVAFSRVYCPLSTYDELHVEPLEEATSTGRASIENRKEKKEKSL